MDQRLAPVVLLGDSLGRQPNLRHKLLLLHQPVVELLACLNKLLLDLVEQLAAVLVVRLLVRVVCHRDCL